MTEKTMTINLIPAWECPQCHKINESLPDAIFEVISSGSKFQCPECKTNIELTLSTHSSDEGDWSKLF